MRTFSSSSAVGRALASFCRHLSRNALNSGLKLPGSFSFGGGFRTIMKRTYSWTPLVEKDMTIRQYPCKVHRVERWLSFCQLNGGDADAPQICLVRVAFLTLLVNHAVTRHTSVFAPTKEYEKLQVPRGLLEENMHVLWCHPIGRARHCGALLESALQLNRDAKVREFCFSLCVQ